MNTSKSITSFTYLYEKKILDTVSQKIYRHISTRTLACIGLFGACLCATGYLFSGVTLLSLHAANVGIILHWIGDSLDGRTAILRNDFSEASWYYIDHIFDTLSLIIILYSVEISPLTHQQTWVWVLLAYVLLMVHVFLKARVYNKFSPSIGKVGPTEARIGLLVINCITMALNNPLVIQIPQVTLLDAFGFGITIVMALLLATHFIRTVKSMRQL